MRKAVEDGEISLNQAAKQIRENKHKPPVREQLYFDFNTESAPDEVEREPVEQQEGQAPESDTELDSVKSGAGLTPVKSAAEQHPATTAKTRETADAEDSSASSGSGKAPDLDGIIQALEEIMPLTGNSTELQKRFRADIRFIKSMMTKGGKKS